MWPSVLSQIRPVPLPVPSTSRMQRSPQARNRLLLLARLIQPGSPHRSMSASTTRPVQHNAPSLLSIFARPHQDGLMRCWRADSLGLCLARDPGITPCCKSLFALVIKNSPGRRRDFRVKMWGTSSPGDKLTGDLGMIETTQIGGRRSDRLMAGKLSRGNFGLLQQYLPLGDIWPMKLVGGALRWRCSPFAS